ncbi:solute carrier family 13 member 5-like isoform X2 [Stegodyphus dumicola]|uniref:solute carrier family 13 member 5-like isoform X2 n=1 Tax=Stegodyphus dumicola TaxID=202533 RepID=UPI0015AB04C4|nr:solute carrier family 13 member 5-like isoform X2 [Stegodyphus dumicola]
MFLLPVFRYRWKTVAGLGIPFLLAPVPLLIGTQESRCGYVILLMACYWVVEPIPVAATSLLPVVLFPLLGVISTNEACSEYMNGTNMMFVGGLFMAVAIEECNLHKRIALNVLRCVGATASWMMLGFMATSMFLSMWISNTATAALMVPIIDAVMQELSDKAKETNVANKRISFVSVDLKRVVDEESQTNSYSKDKTDFSADLPKDGAYRARMVSVLRRAMFLSVAYSTNIGGTGTLTGTGPNLVVKSVTEKLFPESNDLTFDKWMLFNIPVMLFCIFIAWVYLHLVHVRKASEIYTNEMKESFKQIIAKKHEELGPMTFQEKAVSVLFLLLVMLWIFRDPHFISGWGNAFPVKISDATPAMLIPALLFLIPADPWRMGQSPPLLEWKTIQQKVPWGVIILLGGGFALASASEKSGLSKWVTHQLLSLNISSPLAVVSLLSIMTAILTEFTSNVATANVLLPVVAELAVAMHIHPMYLMIPVTISCSFAFMLPVATPPNAIVYEAGEMSTLDMLRPGIFMNLLCVTVEVLMISTYGKVIFHFEDLPSWANHTVTGVS